MADMTASKMQFSGDGEMQSYVSHKRFNSLEMECNGLAFGHVTFRSQRIPSPSVRPVKGECVMTKFRLIGAAALLLTLATPAMAMHHRHHHHYGQPVQGALRLGYGSTYRAYNFYPGHNFAPGNIYNDFDRRNTFN